MSNTVIEHSEYNGDRVMVINKYDINGKLHAENTPASIAFYYSNCKICWKIYYKHGLIHGFNDFPTAVFYANNGCKILEYYAVNGKLHSYYDDEPSYIAYNSEGIVICRKHYKNGVLHNTRGPAVIYYYDNGQLHYMWFMRNGKIHRSNILPAIIEYYMNGSLCSESFYTNGFENRLYSKPSTIEYYPNGIIKKKYYYVNGELFNENGPIMIEYDEDGIITRELNIP